MSILLCVQRGEKMIGLGTIINTIAILIGGVAGTLFGKMLKEKHQEALTMVCGISVLFIGIAGAMEVMMKVDGLGLVSSRGMFIVICLALGTLVGEIIDIEEGLNSFGKWLKIKSGNSEDSTFINSFLTASFTVCIGAMAIVGSIQDGLKGDYSILATKSILDFIVIMVMTSSLGKGAMFSAIPVFILQGSVTVLARFIQPIMIPGAMNNISLVGSVMIFCVGLNLVWGKKVRVANMLPAIVFAVILAFIPINL